MLAAGRPFELDIFLRSSVVRYLLLFFLRDLRVSVVNLPWLQRKPY